MTTRQWMLACFLIGINLILRERIIEGLAGIGEIYYTYWRLAFLC